MQGKKMDRNRFQKAIGVAATGIAAGSLAYILKDWDTGRAVIERITDMSPRSIDTIAHVLGMYSVPAAIAGTMLTPYYAIKNAPSDPPA